MWYVSGTEWQVTAAGPRHRYHIKYAESRDGARWDRRGLVCIDYQSPDKYAFGRPCVIKDADRYRMWYSRRGDSYRMGYAESRDGIVWSREDERCVLDVSRIRAGTPRWWHIPSLPTLPARGSCSTTATDMAVRASASRDRLSDGDGPIQSAAHHRAGVRLHSRSDRPGASGERRAVLAAVRRVAGRHGRMPPGAPDAILHGGARDGGACRRHSARRRSHHAVVHVRLDRQRVRAARRRARLRRHPLRHAQYRRDAESRPPSRTRTRAIVPCTTQALAARWTPSWRSRARTLCR